MQRAQILGVQRIPLAAIAGVCTRKSLESRESLSCSALCSAKGILRPKGNFWARALVTSIISPLIAVTRHSLLIPQ